MDRAERAGGRGPCRELGDSYKWMLYGDDGGSALSEPYSTPPPARPQQQPAMSMPRSAKELLAAAALPRDCRPGLAADKFLLLCSALQTACSSQRAWRGQCRGWTPTYPTSYPVRICAPWPHGCATCGTVLISILSAAAAPCCRSTAMLLSHCLSLFMQRCMSVCDLLCLPAVSAHHFRARVPSHAWSCSCHELVLDNDLGLMPAQPQTGPGDLDLGMAGSTAPRRAACLATGMRPQVASHLEYWSCFQVVRRTRRAVSSGDTLMIAFLQGPTSQRCRCRHYGAAPATASQCAHTGTSTFPG